MKKEYSYYEHGKKVTKEINYIPYRYIRAMLIILLETLEILAAVILLTIYVPYFYIAVIITQVVCVISIIASKDNPDYKIPWLVLVICLPVIGFMIYFMFYSRRLSKRYIKRLKQIENYDIKDDKNEMQQLYETDRTAWSQALAICRNAGTSLYRNTDLTYYKSGEEYFEALIQDLKKAEHFIFMEYFIIEEGLFWNSILDILKEKAASGVEVKVIYDDIGCMSTLSGKYYKTLCEYNIQTIPFSKLRGQANSEFNNRSHRKITVVDNRIGYTGGINIADEYINAITRFGYWKDAGIRLEGEAVNELTKLFLTDYITNNTRDEIDINRYHLSNSVDNGSFIIPFGDGPKPLYEHRVGKTVILNMLYQAKDYVYITTPYIIIDNELSQAIMNAAARNVRVVIVVPHIPDKKLVFLMTQSYYKQFLTAGVEIYEYLPGFIHAKNYIADDIIAMVGTINLDYRSLVHHFENGLWIYNDKVIQDIKTDIEETLSVSKRISLPDLDTRLYKRIIQSVISIFAPLL